MYLYTDYITPAELSGYIRAALEDYTVNRLSLNLWLPDRSIDDLQFRFNRGGGGLTEAATFRSYDTEAPIGKRPTQERVTGELPPISRKIRLGEYERLRQRNARDVEIRDAILDDARNLARQIAARVELARGSALTNGSLALNENGIVATVDFGRSATHSVTAAASWLLAGTNIIDDLLTWKQVYVDTNGVDPGAWLTSTRMQGYMLRNTGIRELLGTVSGTPSVATLAAVQQILQAHGLPPIVTNDAKVSVNGTATRVIPDDVGLFLPPTAASFEDTDLGATLWGTTAEALESDYSLEIAPGIVAGSYRTNDPIAVWTKASAIVLPVLANPDLTFKADLVP